MKFQKRAIELVYTKEALKSFRESPWGKTLEDQKRGLELNEKEYEFLCLSRLISRLCSFENFDKYLHEN